MRRFIVILAATLPLNAFAADPRPPAEQPPKAANAPARSESSRALERDLDDLTEQAKRLAQAIRETADKVDDRVRSETADAIPTVRQKVGEMEKDIDKALENLQEKLKAPRSIDGKVQEWSGRWVIVEDARGASHALALDGSTKVVKAGKPAPAPAVGAEVHVTYEQMPTGRRVAREVLVGKPVEKTP